MAPKFHLFYFKLEGRGEVVRQQFKLAGVEFEDTRITRMCDGDDWFKNWKSKAPFGQVPYLEIDEGDGSDKVVLCEGLCISRYLARRFGLNGDSIMDQARVEMIAECVRDYIETPVITTEDCADEEKKSELTKQLYETMPSTLANFERHLIMNNNGDGFFVGNDITWCDVFFTYRVLWMIHRRKYAISMDQYPKSRALLQRVQSHPRCRDWFKNYTFLPKSQ